MDGIQSHVTLFVLLRNLTATNGYIWSGVIVDASSPQQQRLWIRKLKKLLCTHARLVTHQRLDCLASDPFLECRVVRVPNVSASH